MSTLKADTVQSKSTNTDLTIAGDGTGVPNLEAGFKVGGVAGIPAASIRDDAVTSAKIADDAVVTAAIADDAITAALMADDAVGVAQLSATGTASASNFLRGDNSWAEAGGGKILQVVSTFNNDYATHANTNIDTPAEIITAAITCAATSSKVLVLTQFSGNGPDNDTQIVGIKIYRDSTEIGFGDNTSRNSSEGIAHAVLSSFYYPYRPVTVNGMFVDSPSSTSAITYRLKAFSNYFGGSLGNSTLHQNSGYYNFNTKEQAIATSSIILMEIGA